MAHTQSPETLTEHVADWQAGMSVDAENRLIRNVALAGRESANGYTYSEAALEQATPLYHGRVVFLDHAEQRKPRSTRDIAGTIVEARLVDGRPRGDVQLLPGPNGDTLLALAETNAQGVGFSHVVRGRKAGDVVESIDEVLSVDAVVGPATTTRFSESHNHDEQLEHLETLTRRVDRLAQIVEQQNKPTSHGKPQPSQKGLADDAFLEQLTK